MVQGVLAGGKLGFGFGKKKEPLKKIKGTPKPSTLFDELVRDFLDPQDFYNHLNARGVDFFTGVPDSLLKPFCDYVTDNVDDK